MLDSNHHMLDSAFLVSTCKLHILTKNIYALNLTQNQEPRVLAHIK
jgi:hypothetical protein